MMSQTASGTFDTNELDRINDDIHWLLLITGHVLTEEYDVNEPKSMPDVIMKFSCEQMNYCDQNKSTHIIQHIVEQPQTDLNDETMHGVDFVAQW
jgi:hypothetical protein